MGQALMTRRLGHLCQLAAAVVFFYSLSGFAGVSSSLVGRWDTQCQISGTSSSITSYFFGSDQTGDIAEFDFSTTSNCTGVYSSARTPITYSLVPTGQSHVISFVPLRPQGGPIEFSYKIADVARELKLKVLSFTTRTKDGSTVSNQAPSNTPVLELSKKQFSVTLGDLIRNNRVTLDRIKITRAIQEIRALRDYPYLPAGSDIILRAQTSKPLEASTLTFYNRLTRFIFETENEIQLYSAQYPGNAQCYPHDKKIGLDSDFKLYWNSGDEQVQLVLAHELSHYLYELYLEKLSSNHLSPDGQVSGYGELPGFDGFGERNGIIRDSLAYARQHAEVDGFAVTILESMGTPRKKLKDTVVARDLPVLKLNDANLSTPLEYISSDELPSLIDIYMRDMVMRDYLR